MTDKEKSLKKEFRKSLIQFSTAGFGFVAALAWNEMIKDFIDRFISPGSTFFSKFLYALLVTLLAVLVTYFLTKALQEDNS